MKYVTTLLSGQRCRVEVVRENKLTVWVRLPKGEVVKRHWRRHAVEDCE